MRIRMLIAATALLLATATQAADAVPALQFDGRPAFSEGNDAGYFIWRDADKPERWHVRWTTMGQERHFSGAVTAEGGDLGSLKRIDVESESRIVRPGGVRTTVGPRGRVYTRGQPAVVATRVQDKIEKEDDNRIVFSSTTSDEIDGFDFTVGKKVSAVRFNLEVAGRPIARVVEFGAANHKTEAIPLRAVLN